MKTKTCKYCGTTENLRTRKNQWGRLEIWSVCELCWSKHRSKIHQNKSEEEKEQIKKNISAGTKKGMAEMPEEKRERVRQGHQIYLNSITEEEKKERYERGGKSISEALIKKWAEDEKYRSNQIEVCKQALANRPEEEKQRHYKKISESNITFFENMTEEEREEFNADRVPRIKEALEKYWNNEENIQQHSEIIQAIWDNKTDKEREQFSKSVSGGLQAFFENMTEKEHKVYMNNIVQKGAETRANWTEEQKSENSRKISEANLRKMERHAKTGRCFQSQVEIDCFEYIKQNVDPNIDHQKRYGDWMIDFYSPKYDLYIQLDGIFWHGLANYKDEFLETDLGKAILKTKEKDELQNKTIKNLVRITDEEFRLDPKILDNRIKPKIITKIMNTLY